MKSTRFWFLTALAVLAALSRLAPHPPNFAPLTAVALFGAATFPGRRSGVGIPLASLFLSDVLLQATYRAGWQPQPGFYAGQWVIYACCLATCFIGFALRQRRTIATVALGTFASAVVFFLVTNFVWVYGPASLYPRTIEGLFLSYERALPFFRNSLAGDFFYVTLLFGGLALAEARFPSLRRPLPAAG
jgi:hypothetical protein